MGGGYGGGVVCSEITDGRGGVGGGYKYNSVNGPAPVRKESEFGLTFRGSISRYVCMPRSARESQVILDTRRVPAEIINVSANEIWVIAKPQTQVVHAGEDTPGSGAMSAYTAFIAVDSSRKTTGDHGVTFAVPVPVPDGVRYDTTKP
jgi:hypothetical protein